MTPPALIVRPVLLDFGKRLRAMRRQERLTMTEVCARARMTRQGLRKIERGGNVTLGTIVLLAHALGCQVSYFFPPNTN